MLKITLDDLRTPSPMWAHFFAGEEYECDQIAFARSPAGFVHRIIRGDRCLSKPQLLQEWAAAWQFPAYFGHNWDAFSECISDLYWLPADGYIATITEIHRLLGDERSLVILLEILDSAAAAWTSDHDFYRAKPATPFHVIFQHRPGDWATRRRFSDLAAHLPIEWSELAVERD